jgi:hypothetical protein
MDALREECAPSAVPEPSDPSSDRGLLTDTAHRTVKQAAIGVASDSAGGAPSSPEPPQWAAVLAAVKERPGSGEQGSPSV